MSKERGSKTEIKYLVCPGIVYAGDGDKHYISADELMQLYRVDFRECMIVDSPKSALGLKWENYIVLRPRTDGNYQLPTPTGESK